MICHCDPGLIIHPHNIIHPHTLSTHTSACRTAPALLGVAAVLFVFACLAATSSLSSTLIKCSCAKGRPPTCQRTRGSSQGRCFCCYTSLWTQASHSQSGCNYLTSPLLEFDFDEQNEANQRDDHEESQEDTHVEVFCGLLWKRTTQSCQRILHAC